MAIRKFRPVSPDKDLNKIKGDTEFARLAHLNRLVEDVSKELNDMNISLDANLEFKTGSVTKVSFSKAPNADVKDVIIPGVLELARENNGGGLYNAAIDDGWTNPGPTNTEWSSPYVDPTYTTWAPLLDVSSRTFDTWRDASHLLNGGYAPPMQVGMPMVMRETTTGRIWLIMFTRWDVGEFVPGGGFAYTRYEIFPQVSFTKPDYETATVDKISDGVWLARENNGPLYNAAKEPYSEQRVSPFNTRWNSVYTDDRPGYYGFDDLTNLESRVYSPFTGALDGSIGNNIIGTDLIMHDLTTDTYYKFVFDGWTNNNNGGGFSYTRTAISQSVPVKFADGTIMTSASSSSSSGPVIDGEGNVIIANTSDNTVNVANGASHLIPDFSGMLIVNDHYDGRVETWIAGGGDGILITYSNVGAGPCTNTLTMNGSGYEWTNNDNMTGPFTFTVIKTRNGS